MSFRSSLCLSLALTLLSACDLIGVPDPAKDAARKDADGRATGSACRHAGRAIEDCYALNTDSARAAIYAGWKEMNDYMRENKIEEIKPAISGASAAAIVAAATAGNGGASAAASSANVEGARVVKSGAH